MSHKFRNYSCLGKKLKQQFNLKNSLFGKVQFRMIASLSSTHFLNCYSLASGKEINPTNSENGRKNGLWAELAIMKLKIRAG